MELNQLLNDLSKTKRLEYELTQDIKSRKLKAHDLFLSEREIIEKYKLGRTTVRQAVINLVECGFLYKINGKGAFVAPGVKQQQILIISQYGLTTLLRNSNYSELSFLSGIAKALKYQDSPYVSLTLTTDEFLENLESIELIYKNIVGIIFLFNPQPLLASRKTLDDKDIPYLFYGADSFKEDLKDVNCYVYEQAAVVELALEYLYKQGIKKIGICYVDFGIVRTFRLELFKHWMAEKELPLKDDYFFNLGFDDLQPRVMRYKQTEAYFDQHPIPKDIEAVFCVDDLIARYFIVTANRKGYKIPQNFKVISISNYPFCNDFISPLTSVDIPFFEDGKKCANLIIRCYEGEISRIREKSKISLIARESA